MNTTTQPNFETIEITALTWWKALKQYQRNDLINAYNWDTVQNIYLAQHKLK